jgi:hypothetical protein
MTIVGDRQFGMFGDGIARTSHAADPNTSNAPEFLTVGY